MLVAIICQLIVAAIASPYHKYPFAFLLDVGNEELTNTNTEQIRLSLPGGSLAVRYPAISDGDVITHVRVSSIDFGSDLKASILDGGPGYKFVVLVFLGNSGVACDAVITLQTLPNQGSNSEQSIASWSVNSMSKSDVSQSEINNSVEDMSNEIETPRKNADLAIQSSNVNNYAQLSKGDDDNDDENEESSETKDELDDDDKGPNIQEDSNEVSEESDDKEQNSSNESDEDDDHEERFHGYQRKYNNEFKSINEQLLDQDERVYIQDLLYDRQGHNSGEDSIELDQTYNDEEIHNDPVKYKDSNNNNFETEYESAVA